MNPNNKFEVMNAFRVGNSPSTPELIQKRHSNIRKNTLLLRKLVECNKDEQDFAHIYGYL